MIQLIFVTALLIFLIYRLYKHVHFVITINKIGGPKLSLYGGNLKDILVPPEKLFVSCRMWAKEYYPIYRIIVMHCTTINVFTPGDMEIFLGSMKHTEKSEIYNMLHEWLGSGLLTSSGKKWQTRRKILTPTFHFNILQQFIPIFVEHGKYLMDKFESYCDKEFVDILPDVAYTTLKTVCETSMGTKLSEKDKSYRQNVERFGETALYRFQRPWMHKKLMYVFYPAYYKQRIITNALQNFSNNVINQRRKIIKKGSHNNNDINRLLNKKRLAMLDLLLEKEGDLINHEGIREEVDTFVFEGHDTTSISIAFTLLLLANNKDIQDKVVEELENMFEDLQSQITYSDLQNMPYMDRVIKESLRLYPSVPFIARLSSDDVTTATGYFIEKGTMVHCHIYDLHRIPSVWPNPEKFDPDRFLPENIRGRHPYAYIPFSAGPRNCIGQKFAMLEMKAILALILMKLELFPIDTPETISFKCDIILRPVNGIKIKFKHRKTFKNRVLL